MNEGVYLVGSDFNGPMKIGVSNNIASRISSLQTSTHKELKLFGYFSAYSDDRLDNVDVPAPILEKVLHKLLNHKKIKNEWFDISLCDVFSIQSLTLGELDKCYTKAASSVCDIFESHFHVSKWCEDYFWDVCWRHEELYSDTGITLRCEIKRLGLAVNF